MAEIYPFRGLTYNQQRINSYDEVVTQPYDKITPRMREQYLNRSPYNIARIIVSAPEGADLQAHFERAASVFGQWRESGIIERSDKPRLYAYYQTYSVPGTGESRTRRSFIGLGKLHEYSDGVIKPHEKTHSGPKLDRLTLTRATGCQFGMLFMLYPDSENRVNEILDSKARADEPLIQVEDENGVIHRVWELDDPAKIAGIQELMKPKSLYIADGHHRYETAVTYWKEQEAAGVKIIGDEAIDRAMMTFVSSHDEGLSVLPTHRMIASVSGYDPSAMLDELKTTFAVEKLGPRSNELLLKTLEENLTRKHSFVFVSRELDDLYRIQLKPTEDPRRLIGEKHSDSWKQLDVTILHKLIIERVVGITEEDLEKQRKVGYYRDPLEALELVRSGSTTWQAAFFLNPTGVGQVVEVADNGDCMPQKSTDFYPKMLTGLVVNRLNLK